MGKAGGRLLSGSLPLWFASKQALMLPRLGGHSQIMFTERFYVCTRSEQHDDNPLNFGKIPFRSATSACTTISLCLSSKWSFATN